MSPMAAPSARASLLNGLRTSPSPSSNNRSNLPPPSSSNSSAFPNFFPAPAHGSSVVPKATLPSTAGLVTTPAPPPPPPSHLSNANRSKRYNGHAREDHTLGPTFDPDEDGDDSEFIASRMAALGLDPNGQPYKGSHFAAPLASARTQQSLRIQQEQQQQAQLRQQQAQLQYLNMQEQIRVQQQRQQQTLQQQELQMREALAYQALNQRVVVAQNLARLNGWTLDEAVMRIGGFNDEEMRLLQQAAMREEQLRQAVNAEAARTQLASKQKQQMQAQMMMMSRQQPAGRDQVGHPSSMDVLQAQEQRSAARQQIEANTRNRQMLPGHGQQIYQTGLSHDEPQARASYTSAFTSPVSVGSIGNARGGNFATMNGLPTPQTDGSDGSSQKRPQTQIIQPRSVSPPTPTVTVSDHSSGTGGADSGSPASIHSNPYFVDAPVSIASERSSFDGVSTRSPALERIMASVGKGRPGSGSPTSKSGVHPDGRSMSLQNPLAQVFTQSQLEAHLQAQAQQQQPKRTQSAGPVILDSLAAAGGYAVVTRQPKGPPKGADELGGFNFASRIRKKAGLDLSLLGRRASEMVPLAGLDTVPVVAA